MRSRLSLSSSLFCNVLVKKRILTVLGLLFGLALFAGMVYISGPQKCLEALQQAGFLCFLSFFGLLALQILFFTLGWQALLRGAGYQPPLYWTGVCQIMGYLGNNLTPSMYLGGEPVAAYFLARTENLSTRRVMGTMITSKFMQLFAFLILFFTGSYLLLSSQPFVEGLPSDYAWFIAVMKWVDVIAAVGSVVLLLLVFTGRHALTGLIRLLARMNLFPYSMMRIKPKIRDMETTIHEAFQKSWPDTITCFVYSVFAMLTIYARPIIYFQFVDANEAAFSSGVIGVTLVNAAMFFTLSQLVQVFQFTPGGLGIFDAASVAIFYHVFEISNAYGMGFNLIFRLADAVIICLGAYLTFRYGALMFLKESTLDTR